MIKPKRVKLIEVDERVKLAYQLRVLIGADRRLFYDRIWLWPAPPAPPNEGFTPDYGEYEWHRVGGDLVCGFNSFLSLRLWTFSTTGVHLARSVNGDITLCCCLCEHLILGLEHARIHQKYKVCVSGHFLTILRYYDITIFIFSSHLFGNEPNLYIFKNQNAFYL